MKTLSVAILVIVALLLACCTRSAAKTVIDIRSDTCGDDFAIPADTQIVLKFVDAEAKAFSPLALRGMTASTLPNVSSQGCLAVSSTAAQSDLEIALPSVGLYRTLSPAFLERSNLSQAVLVKLLPPHFVDLRRACGLDPIFSTQTLVDLHRGLIQPSSDDEALRFSYAFQGDKNSFALQLNSLFQSNIPIGTYDISISAQHAEGRKIFWRVSAKDSAQVFPQSPICHVQTMAEKPNLLQPLGMQNFRDAWVINEPSSLRWDLPSGLRLVSCLKTDSTCSAASDYSYALPAFHVGEQELCYALENPLGQRSDTSCHKLVVDREAPKISIRWVNEALQGTLPQFSGDIGKTLFEIEIGSLTDLYSEQSALKQVLECRVGFLDRSGQRIAFLSEHEQHTATCLNGACQGMDMGDFKSCSSSLIFQLETSYQDVIGKTLVVEVRSRDQVGNSSVTALYAGLHDNRQILPGSLGKKVWALSIDDINQKVWIASKSDLSVQSQNLMDNPIKAAAIEVNALKRIGNELIAGTRAGVQMQSLPDGKATVYPETGVTLTIAERDDGLYVGGDNGLFRWSPSTKTWDKLDKMAENGRGEGVFVMADSPHGLLLSSYAEGLFLWNATRGLYDKIDWPQNILNELSAGEVDGLNLVSSLATAPDGSVWVGTEIGLIHIKDPEHKSMSLHRIQNTSTATSAIYSIAFETASSSTYFLLLGTDNGLIRWNQRETVEIFDKSNSSLPNNNIRSIERDTKGRLWIGTEGGAVLFAARDWLLIGKDNSNIANTNVATLDWTDTQNLCAAGDGGMLSCFVHGTWTNSNLLRILGETIRSIRYYGESLWLAGDEWASLIPQESMTNPKVSQIPEAIRTVYDSLKTPSGQELISTTTGVYARDMADRTWNRLETGCTDDCESRRILLDPFDSDKVWFNDNRGFYSYSFSSRAVRSVCHSPDFDDFDVKDFTRDNAGHFVILGRKPKANQLWTCEPDNGIVDHLLPFEENILSLVTIRTLLRDRDHGLWVGTDSGLFRLDLGTGALRPQVETFEFTGLSIAAVNQIKQDSAGYLWLATSNGIIRSAKPASALHRSTLSNGERDSL